ncbi:hypothetical protein MASR1M107_20430 [Ignavibacteriales bacterium]
MRTKTLLLFFLFFTGIGFSQDKNADQEISVGEINALLWQQQLSMLMAKAESYGYKSDAGSTIYTKGDHVFRISFLTDKGPFEYTESKPSQERINTLKEQALKFGCKLMLDDQTGVLLQGKGLTIRIRTNMIKISLLKPK